MTVEKDAALLLANLKGSKRNKPSNLIEIAAACRRLKAKWGLKKMMDVYDISKTQLDWIDSINDLHEDVRAMVKSGTIGMEKGYFISKLDIDVQPHAAKEAIEMNGRQTRQFVHLLKDKDMSVPEAKELVKKLFDNKIHLIVLPLTTETYLRLKKIADDSKENIHDLSLKALESFINERRRK
ncbi:MAG: hypothetical protein QXJ74_05450 [Nitrososphaera sp.]